MSSAVLTDRQLKPVYDALDTGATKAAILACNKILKKQPNNALVQTLKALALVRSAKVEEALVLSEEVLASKPVDQGVLNTMLHVLRALGRHSDIVMMYDNAYKLQPGNEELGAQTFFAYTRTATWNVASQVATKMYKTFKDDRYLYWSVLATMLQARDPLTPPDRKTLLFKLAHRLLPTSTDRLTADRLHVHLTILRELKLYDEAFALLKTDAAEYLCKNSLSANEIRREVMRAGGRLLDEGERAEKQIVELKDRNWLEYQSVLDATFSYVSSDAEVTEEAKAKCAEHLVKSRAILEKLAEEEGTKDRSSLLALVELEYRARKHGISSDLGAVAPLLQRYFEAFGDKAVCFEDLKAFVPTADDSTLTTWTDFLLQKSYTLDNLVDLQRTINIGKFIRYSLVSTTAEEEVARAQTCTKQYLTALPLGADLPETELQPADDLVLLAASAYVNAWTISREEAHLFCAAAVLEYAITKSKQAYNVRLYLIQIYRLLGAPSVVLDHYRMLNLKQFQHDTLSYLLLARANTFSLGATGDLTLAQECMEASQIYLSNSQETSDFIVRAFTQEKYSMVPDFLEFDDMLESSVQRDLLKVEHVRMRFPHEQLIQDLIDMELIEMKFIFDRTVQHDTRDLNIIPNYQPRDQPTFAEQTLMFKKDAGKGWLFTFLKMYVRILQQASDVSESIEERLLICDRPKKSTRPEDQIPITTRLATRKEDELAELTPDELKLYDFVEALAGWLGPHHDWTRPTPEQVLAEAAKQQEKAGITRPLFSLAPLPADKANGHSKKDEDAPSVTEPPALLSQFFDDMTARFKTLSEDPNTLRPELLQVVTLVQEALILLTIDTARYSNAATVRQYKLGILVQHYKPIKAKASATLRELAKELAKVGETEGTSDKRLQFVARCKPVWEPSEEKITHDFVLNVAKKVTDSRKKVLEGVAKGALKVSTTYES